MQNLPWQAEDLMGVIGRHVPGDNDGRAGDCPLKLMPKKASPALWSSSPSCPKASLTPPPTHLNFQQRLLVFIAQQKGLSGPSLFKVQLPPAAPPPFLPFPSVQSAHTHKSPLPL